MTRAPNPTFAERLTHLAPELRAFVGRRVRDAATADDLTQETLLKAWRAQDDLHDVLKVEAWLYRTARHTLIDHWRRLRPAETVDAAEVGTVEDDRERIIAAVARAARCYLGTLPERYRVPVELAEDGESFQAIAARLGLTLTAVKSRVRRGRAEIRRLMEACCEFQFDAQGRIVDYRVRRCPRCA